MRRARLLAAVAACVAAATLVRPTAARPADQRRGLSLPGRDGGAGRGAGPGRAGTDSRIQRRTYRFEDTNEQLEYAVFVSSKVDNRTPAPLVIALHGLGVPPANIVGNLLDPAQKGGYIVAAPTGYTLQGWYGAQGQTSASNTPANLGELSEKDVMNVLALMRRDFNVNPNRTYLLGQSMGGGGAVYLGVKHREIWAALALSAPAIPQRLQPAMLEDIRTMPVILAHSDTDASVPTDRILPWLNEMRELQMPFEYVELHGLAHPDTIGHAAPRIFAFFAAHSRDQK